MLPLLMHKDSATLVHVIFSNLQANVEVENLTEKVQAKHDALDSAMAQHDEQARSWHAQCDAILSGLEVLMHPVLCKTCYNLH